MICDAHFHIFPEFRGYGGKGEVRGIGGGLVQYTTGELNQAIPPAFDATAFPLEAGLGYMGFQHVDTAFLMQATYYGIHNDYVSHAVASHPDKFRGAICIDPMAKYWRQILERAVDELHLSAVKLEMSEDYGLTGIHPQLRVTDKELDPFWSRVVEYRLPFIIDPGWSGTLGNRPSDIRTLIGRYPDLQVVVAHLGQPTATIVGSNVGILRDDGHLDHQHFERDESWMQWIRLAADVPQLVAFDLSILPAFAGVEDYPFPTAQEYVRFAAEEVGASRLMWASDMPSVLLHVTYEQSIDWVRKHCEFFKPGELELVMGANAHGVYGFPAATTEKASEVN